MTPVKKPEKMSWDSKLKLLLAIMALLGGTAGLGVVWGETKALLNEVVATTKRLTTITENHEKRINDLERK